MESLADRLWAGLLKQMERELLPNSEWHNLVEEPVLHTWAGVMNQLRDDLGGE